MDHIMYVDCPYRTDNNGNLIKEGINPKVVEIIMELKDYAAKLNKCSDGIQKLIYVLEINLIKFPKADWIDKNRSKLRNEVWTISELKVSLGDTDEERKEKLLIGAKLMELIES